MKAEAGIKPGLTVNRQGGCLARSVSRRKGAWLNGTRYLNRPTLFFKGTFMLNMFCRTHQIYFRCMSKGDVCPACYGEWSLGIKTPRAGGPDPTWQCTPSELATDSAWEGREP